MKRGQKLFCCLLGGAALLWPVLGATQEQRMVDVNDPAFRDSVTRAAMTIVGTVEQQRIPTAKALAEGTLPPGRISEHIPPQADEFIIEVQEVLSGPVQPGDEIVVRVPRFEGPPDVAFVFAPHLQVGQRSLFVLEPDNLFVTGEAQLGGQTVPAFVAARGDAVLPPETAAQVRSIIEQ